MCLTPVPAGGPLPATTPGRHRRPSPVRQCWSRAPGHLTQGIIRLPMVLVNVQPPATAVEAVEKEPARPPPRSRGDPVGFEEVSKLPHPANAGRTRRGRSSLILEAVHASEDDGGPDADRGAKAEQFRLREVGAADYATVGMPAASHAVMPPKTFVTFSYPACLRRDAAMEPR